jgi:predicted transcriptional regulator
MREDYVIRAVYMPASYLHKLRKIAKRRDTSVNALIVEAIEQWLEKEGGIQHGRPASEKAY